MGELDFLALYLLRIPTPSYIRFYCNWWLAFICVLSEKQCELLRKSSARNNEQDTYISQKKEDRQTMLNMIGQKKSKNRS